MKFEVWSMYSFLDVLEVLLLLYIKSGCVLHICNERIRLRGKVKFEFRRGKKPEKLDSPYCEREEEI